MICDHDVSNEYLIPKGGAAWKGQNFEAWQSIFQTPALSKWVGIEDAASVVVDYKYGQTAFKLLGKKHWSRAGEPNLRLVKT